MNYKYTLSPGDQEGATEDYNVTLVDLNPCTEYTLYVSAVTNAGIGVKGTSTETTENDGKHTYLRILLYPFQEFNEGEKQLCCNGTCVVAAFGVIFYLNSKF